MRRFDWYGGILGCLVMLASFGLAISATSFSVSAQSDPLQFDTATPAENANDPTGVNDQSVSPAEIEAATTTYFAAVESYRLEENRYALARDQYYQLNTLAAQDEAIRRAKEVLRVRIEVLQAYFSYLSLILQNTKGIDLNDKAVAQNLLVSWQVQLESSLQKVPAANDRQQVNALFDELNLKSKEIQSAAFGTLILIKIGEMQTAIDTATLLQQRTAEALEGSTTLGAADKEIGKRGLEEITTLLQRARNNVFTLNESYREDTGRQTFSEASYRTFQTDAEFTYVQLRQVVDFLREVQKGIR